MTLLTVCQRAALEVGLSEPSSIVSSPPAIGNQLNLELEQFAFTTGEDVRSRYGWAALRKEATITLVASTAGYALPDDFDRAHYDTHWDRSNQWKLGGPLSPQEWKAVKEGVGTTLPRFRFTIFGYDETEFTLDPTPTSDEAGDILVYEYQSTEWFAPKKWVTATAYIAGQYVSYQGTNYTADNSGTSTGSTGPTGDGGVTWTAETTAYRTFNADTDIFKIPEKIIELGIIWRFLRANGLPYEHCYREYEDYVANVIGNLRGSRKLNLAHGSNMGVRFLSSDNVPDSGWS